MARTFSGTYTTTQVLSSPTSDNPATVTSNGLIVVNSPTAFQIGLFGNAGFGWTITNLGTVESIGSLGIGIQLQSGGSITNGTSGSGAGLIEGSHSGIIVNGSAGTITNFGSVISTSTGTSGNAVVFNAGGTLSNYGLIAGGGNTNASVGANNFSGTVHNFGTITTTTNSNGVNLNAGGVVTNSGVLSSVGTNGSGLFISTGTVTNTGTISTTGTNSSAVNVGPGGGTIVNGQSGTTVGLITGYHNAIGFFPGTAASPGTLTVVNYGRIESTQPGTAAGTGLNGFAINTGTNSTSVIDNFGTIAASQTNGGGGILLGGGGQITNEAGALIDGAAGAGISTPSTGGAAITVTNFGTIRGSANPAFSTILIFNGGTVINKAGG